MANDKIEFRKIRDFGELLNITFEFIRQNFKKIFLSLLFIAGPAIVISGVVQVFYESNMFSFKISFDDFIFSAILIFFTTFITFQIILTVSYSFIELYLDKETNNFEINDIWIKTKSNFLMLTLTSLGTIIIIGLASLLLIIPGIYLAIVLTIIYIVRLREKRSFFEAVSRCRELMSGNWWYTFALLLILTVIQVFLSFILSIPEYVMLFIGFLHMQDGNTPPRGINIITSVIASFGYIFYSIIITGVTFHYYSLVEKKEAVGLLQKLDSINT